MVEAASSRRRSIVSPATGSETFAGQQAKDRRALRREDEEGVDAGPQPLLVGRLGADRAHHGLDQLVQVGVEQDDLQLALGREVLVDERLRDPAAAGDVVERRLGEAALGEDVERSLEDRRAAIRRGQAPARRRLVPVDPLHRGSGY